MTKTAQVLQKRGGGLHSSTVHLNVSTVWWDLILDGLSDVNGSGSAEQWTSVSQLVHSSAQREHFLVGCISYWAVAVMKLGQVEARSGGVRPPAAMPRPPPPTANHRRTCVNHGTFM